MALLSRSWAWYTQFLDTAPITSRVVATVPILIGADSIAQYLGDEAWNYRRTVGMAMYGGVWIAPVSYWWYKFLHTKSARLAERHLLRTAVTTAIDQLFMSPWFVSVFLITRGVVDHQTPTEIVQKIRTDAFNVWAVGCYVWTPAAFVNFFLVPPKYRVLFMNCVSFLWNTFLATTVRYERKKHTQKDDQIADKLEKLEI